MRALADIDGRHPQDLFFTGAILGDVIQRQKRPYDPYEPRTMAELSAAELRRYSLIVAEAGVLTRAELEPIARAERPGIVFIEGADREGLNAELTGVTNFERTVRGAPVPLGPLSATAEAADL